MGKRTTELQRAINSLEAEKAEIRKSIDAIQKSIDVLKVQQASKPARKRNSIRGTAFDPMAEGTAVLR